MVIRLGFFFKSKNLSYICSKLWHHIVYSVRYWCSFTKSNILYYKGQESGIDYISACNENVSFITYRWQDVLSLPSFIYFLIDKEMTLSISYLQRLTMKCPLIFYIYHGLLWGIIVITKFSDQSVAFRSS